MVMSWRHLWNLTSSLPQKRGSRCVLAPTAGNPIFSSHPGLPLWLLVDSCVTSWVVSEKAIVSTHRRGKGKRRGLPLPSLVARSRTSNLLVAMSEPTLVSSCQ